jgi:hypothetical protein
MDKFCIKKSYKDGHVGLRFSVKAHAWNGDSIKIDGGSDLSTAAARDLARALIEEADRADAKVAAKTASDERRKKWRDKEIAAGRLKVMSLGDLMQRR